jgi:hypothetical protein
MPTLLVELTKSPTVPLALLTLKQFPAPNCRTDRAFPEAVLPKTRQFDVFKIVFTVGAP